MAHAFGRPLIKWKVGKSLLAKSRKNAKVQREANVDAWGAWVAPSAEWPTLDFGSGRGLRVVRSSPVSGSALNVESV